MILQIIGFLLIILFLYLIYIIIETNQIAKRNYEKLDKILLLMKKHPTEDTEQAVKNEPEETF